MSSRQVATVLCIIMCGAGLATAQTVWEQWPGNPMVGPGLPGSWDEGGRWILNVIFDGSTYHMWFAGDNLASTPTDIGHATSPDGLQWEMDDANPVLTRGEPGQWDASGLIGAAVVYDGLQFRMWYSGGWPGSERAGYATSPDGSFWTKYDPDNPVIDVGEPGSADDSAVRPNTVIADGGTLRMWYGCVNSTVPGVRTCMAESEDGITWTKYPDNPVLEPTQGWETGTYSPYVIADGLTYHMWYVGTHSPYFWGGSVGYAYSTNGIRWTKDPGNPVMVQPAGEPVYASPVLLEGGTYRMWYSHWNGARDRISYATSICCNAGLFADDFEKGDTWQWSVTVP